MVFSKKKPDILGQLEIVARTARNLNQKVIVGKQSPYVQFHLNSVIKQTVCDKRGGRSPQWSDIITFPIDIESANLTVIIYNRKSKVQSDYIGEVVVELNSILVDRELDSWFGLKDRDNYAGDVYLEFTYYPKGVPKPTTLNRMKAKEAINEIEEGLSILQLKNIRHDINNNKVELPLDRTLLKKDIIQEQQLQNKSNLTTPILDENSPLFRKPTVSSELSFNDSEVLSPTLANEQDLNNILDEIRGLVDYPYQLPPNPQDQSTPIPGPGALPAMPTRRKPLPKIPQRTPVQQQQQQQQVINNELYSTPILNEPSPSSDLYSPISNENTISQYYQNNPTNNLRSISPANTSMISDFALGTPLQLSRNTTLTRRGSVDTLHTLKSSNLDFDPTQEIETIDYSKKTKSIKKRPIEAPSILQSNFGLNGSENGGLLENQSNYHIPCAEDVRGKPILIYQNPHNDGNLSAKYYPPKPSEYPPTR